VSNFDDDDDEDDGSIRHCTECGVLYDSLSRRCPNCGSWKTEFRIDP
jgi:rubrerythrin